MGLNRKHYNVEKIYSSADGKADPSKITPTTHKFFYTKGEYLFGKLDLIAYKGWEIICPLNNESNKDKMVVSVRRDSKNKIISSLKEENHYKTLICENKSERALALMYLDLKNNYHELDIVLRNSPEGTLEKTLSMLERELKCKWEDRPIIEEETPVSDLIDRIESK
jgi:hypothetical protein